MFHFFIPEEIGIDSPDEREVILSEIYRRFHPEEEDMFEMEIQGKMKCLGEKESCTVKNGLQVGFSVNLKHVQHVACNVNAVCSVIPGSPQSSS